MAGTITRKTKGKAKERPKDAQPTGTKEGGELVPFLVGRYLIHRSSNVIHMQALRFNSIWRSRTSISCQRNLPFYSKG